MRWISIRTWEYEKQAKKCWHYWFAWHPVTIKEYPDGAAECVWLVMLKRRGTRWCDFDGSGWDYEYKKS